MDVVCEAGGGFGTGKTPINEEYLIILTLMSLYFGVFRSGTLFALLVIALGVMKYTLEEISTQNGPFNFYSNSMSSFVSQWNCFKFEIPYRY